jgi:alanine racemase
MLSSRPTKIKIKIKNLVNNLNIVKNILKKKSQIIAVVKADAYGHGSIEIAKELNKHNIDFFGVACAYEAKKLFSNGIKGNILSLGKIYREDIELTEKFPYILTVSSIEDLNELESLNREINVHVKFDTGMGRCGFYF